MPCACSLLSRRRVAQWCVHSINSRHRPPCVHKLSIVRKLCSGAQEISLFSGEDERETIVSREQTTPRATLLFRRLSEHAAKPRTTEKILRAFIANQRAEKQPPSRGLLGALDGCDSRRTQVALAEMSTGFGRKLPPEQDLEKSAVLRIWAKYGQEAAV